MMQFSPDALFVGTVDAVGNCTTGPEQHAIEPKLMLMVFLQGSQRFEIDGELFAFDAGQGQQARPVGVFLNVARATTVRFIDESAVPLRKVMVSAPLSWLRHATTTGEPPTSQGFSALLASHLGQVSFAPGSNLLRIAERIFNPAPGLEGEMKSIYLTAQGLDLLWQSWLLLPHARQTRSPDQSQSARLQAERVRDFIAANLTQDLTIDLIAAEARSSASTIQRNFKARFGLSIFEFVQQMRLEIARNALVADGVRVSHAAHLAGYGSTASFTTAFRRAYGVSPRQLRH